MGGLGAAVAPARPVGVRSASAGNGHAGLARGPDGLAALAKAVLRTGATAVTVGVGEAARAFALAPLTSPTISAAAPEGRCQVIAREDELGISAVIAATEPSLIGGEGARAAAHGKHGTKGPPRRRAGPSGPSFVNRPGTTGVISPSIKRK